MQSVVVVTSWWSNCLALRCLQLLAQFAAGRSLYVMQAGKSASQMQRFRKFLPHGVQELHYPQHLAPDDSRMREYLAREALRDVEGAWFIDHDTFILAPAEAWFAQADASFSKSDICLCTGIPRAGPGLTQPAYWLSPRRWPPNLSSFDPVPFQVKEYCRRPDLHRPDGPMTIPGKDTLVQVAEELAAVHKVGTFPLTPQVAARHALPSFPAHQHLGGIHLYTGPLGPAADPEWVRHTVTVFDRFFSDCSSAWLANEEPELLRRYREFRDATVCDDGPVEFAVESPEADLYAVPVADRWLLFSPQIWTAAVVNRSAVASVGRCIAGDDATVAPDLRQLCQQLTRKHVPERVPREAPEKIVIMPTRACNMRCVYCDFAAATATQTTLDPRLACRLLDDYAKQLVARGADTLRVHFFGGEPLVARTCTVSIVHYARSLCAHRGLVPWFELTTNGYFDPGVVPFIGDHIDSVVVSLDGPEAIHDFNRKRIDGRGTYAAIAANIRRLARFPVGLCLRTCITQRSVDTMEDIAARFCTDFEFDVLSFEMLAENESGRRSGLSAPDPYAFAAGLLKAETLAAKQGVRVVQGPSELEGPRTTSCPLGQGTLMLTPEGQVTACYLNPERWMLRGLDLVMGRVNASGGVFIDYQKREAISAQIRSKPRCVRCFCRHTCAGGCHVDQTPPGCSLDYDSRCRAIRVITAGRLLRSLGCLDDADTLISRLSAMQTLANHPDDRLSAWHGNPPRENH